jgi:hypothetical protein
LIKAGKRPVFSLLFYIPIPRFFLAAVLVFEPAENKRLFWVLSYFFNRSVMA